MPPASLILYGLAHTILDSKLSASLLAFFIFLSSKTAKALIVNIIALCAFPFIGKPLLKVIIFDDDEVAYNNFLDNRKKEVTDLILDSIKAV